jgi:hypothetical protein
VATDVEPLGMRRAGLQHDGLNAIRWGVAYAEAVSKPRPSPSAKCARPRACCGPINGLRAPRMAVWQW